MQDSITFMAKGNAAEVIYFKVSYESVDDIYRTSRNR